MLVSLGNVSNESFSTPASIALLKVGDWLNSGGGSVVLSAASIGLLDSRGDFGPSITAQSLGAVKIAGSITGGNWTVAGAGLSLVADNVDAGWSANFTGSLGFVRFVNDGGNLTASSIGRSLRM